MNKDIFVGEIRQHLSQAAPTTRPKRGRRIARLLGFGGGGIGLLKTLIILTVTAALISTMIGTYLVTQTDEITLEGRLSYDLFIDDVPMGADDYAMPPDTFTDDKLTWGETEIFTHEFYSPPNNGNFSVTIDQSWQTWLNNPAHEFYGYTFVCLDETDTPITHFTVMTGQPARVIKFKHYLDLHFAATPNPLPYALTLEVEEYGVMAVDDTHNTGGTTITYADVMANDINHTGSAMHITAVTQVEGQSAILLTIVNDTIEVYVYPTVLPGTYTATYTITAGSASDIGTLTIIKP